MLLNTVAGTTYPAVLDEILNKINTREPSLNGRHILIVPDRFTLMTEIALVEKIGGAFDVTVSSLNRLYARHCPVAKYLSSQAAVMLVGRILKERASEFVCFSPRVPGLAGELARTISALKACRITPQDLCGIEGRLQYKLEDIAKVYFAYEDYIEKNGMIDHSGKLGALAAQAADFAGAHIYFALYDAFGAQERYLIEQLLRRAQSVTLGAVTGEGAYYLNEISAFALVLAASTGAPHAITRVADNVPPAFSHVLRHAGSFDPPPFDGDCPINLFFAHDSQREAEEVCRAVSRGVRSGRRYKDYGIVNGGIHPSELSAVLSRYGIPHYIDNPEPLGAHPLAQFITAALGAVVKNFARLNMLELAFNCYSGICADDFEQFDNFCLRFAVDYSRFALPLTIGRDTEGFETAEKTRARLYSIVEPFLRCRTYDGFCAAARALLEFAPLLNDDGNARNKILAALDECEKTLGGISANAAEFCETLSAVFDSSDLSQIPPHTDAVFVGSPENFRLTPALELFVINFADGALPAVSRAGGLLTEVDRAALRAKGVATEPSAALVNARARFDLLHAVCAPKNAVTFSYCDKPSNIIAGITELFPSKVSVRFSDFDASYDTDAALERLSYAYPTIAAVRAALARRLRRGEATDDETRALFAVAGGAFDVPKQEALPPLPPQKDLYAGATELETFFSCPFKHFLQYRLRLRQREEGGFKPSDIGTILHSVVEMYVSSGMPDNIPDAVRKILDEELKKRGDMVETVGTGILRRLADEAVVICGTIKDETQSSLFEVFKTEVRFSPDSGIAPVSIPTADGGSLTIGGIIDRADIFEDYVRIIDYKTGRKVGISPSEVYYGVKIQLFVYLQALINLGLKPAGVFYLRLHNEFVKDDKRCFLDGFALKDVRVLAAMDNALNSGGSSGVLPVSFDTDKKGCLRIASSGTERSRLLTDADFRAICGYVQGLAARAARLISEGYRQCTPIELNGLACTYCGLSSVCYFDETEDRSRVPSASITVAAFYGEDMSEDEC